MTNPPAAPSRPSRRALMQGLSWATPTAIVSVAAPAFAVSPTPGQSCPDLPPVTGARSTKGVTISQLVKTSQQDDGDPATSTNADELIRDIDAVVAIGGTGIRTNISWDFVQSSGAFIWDGKVTYPPDAPFTLDPLMVSEFTRVIAYARAQGITTVEIMVIGTFHDQSFPEADWWTVTNWWWEGIATALAPVADIVQIFNEATGNHYRFYQPISDADKPAYLRDMAAKISTARGYFRAANPAIRATTNLYGWPVGDTIEAVWMSELAVLAPVMDLITLDAYIDWSNWPDQVANLSRLYERVARIREAFCMPVSIGEIGDSTTGSGSQAEQSRRFQVTLDELNKPDSPIESVFLYTLRDNLPASSADYDSEASFGLMTVDGQPKQVYRDILARGGLN